MKHTINIFILISILFFLATMKLNAQEFVQFFKFPQIINPAFSGNDNCFEIQTANRLHYVAPGLFFSKNLLDINTNVPEIYGGIQLKALVSQSPGKIFSSYDYSFAYSYSFRIDRYRKINLALETEYKNVIFNNTNLIFPSMLDVWGNISRSSSAAFTNYSLKKLFFNTGILFQTRNNYLGISLKNLYSFYFGQKFKTPYQLAISFQKKNIVRKNEIKINIYSNIFSDLKQKYNFLNGIEIEYLSTKAGIFSIQNIYSGQLSNGTMTFAGISYKKWEIIYSYEFFYGSLFQKRSSLHELSLKYQINCREKKRKNTIICPAYQL